ERVFQCVDGAVDQARLVVDRQYLDAFGEAAGDPGNLRLDVLDHREGVFPVALQYDAADDFAFAVELGQPTPLVRAKLDARHVADAHGSAPLGLQHDLLEIGYTSQIPAAAHHVLALAHLDDAATDVHVAGADGLGDFRERDAVRAQLGRVDDDLV